MNANAVRASLVALGVACVTCSSVAAETQLGLTTGADFSSGTYGGTDRIDTLVFPVVAKVQSGRLAAKLIAAYIVTKGPAVAKDLGTTLPSQRTRETQEGFGDLILGATYDAYVDDDRAQGLSVGGTVSVPTADRDKGLSTGEYNYTGQLDGYKGFNRLFALATVGYRVLGDPPDLKLRDVFFGSVGGGYRASDVVTWVASYDTRQAITSRSSAASSLMISWVRRLSPQARFILYGSVGFSASTPDYGLGAMISMTFDVSSRLERPRTP